MPSRRSKIVKTSVKIFHPRAKSHELSNVDTYRRRFNRAMILNSPVPKGTKVEKSKLAGVKVEWISTLQSTDKIIFYLHGGGFIFGSPRTHRGLIANIARASHTRALAIDYSLAPENPYPKALDEIENVWLSLLQDSNFNPKQIAIVGDSAGAHLALVTALRLRDKHLPMPSCLVLLSPALDTSLSGKTMKLNAKKDPLLSEERILFLLESYAQGASLNDPYISPLISSFKNIPPILVHVGTEEVLLSDSQTLAEKARADGGKVELYVGEGMWHNWHMFSYLPEAKSALQDIGKFIQENTR